MPTDLNRSNRSSRKGIGSSLPPRPGPGKRPPGAAAAPPRPPAPAPGLPAPGPRPGGLLGARRSPRKPLTCQGLRPGPGTAVSY